MPLQDSKELGRLTFSAPIGVDGEDEDAFANGVREIGNDAEGIDGGRHDVGGSYTRVSILMDV